MKFFRRIFSLLILILGGFLGWQARVVFGPSAAPSASFAERTRASGLTLLEGIPDVRQSTSYSCGSAALQAVLQYYGVETREDHLMRELKTNPDAGTHPADIIRVAKQYGLTAALREGLKIEDLKAALDRGVPIIVAIQAWRDELKSGVSWAGVWEDGHYVIVLGLDAANVYVEDPSLLGCRGIIPRAEFQDRWHDYEGRPPFDPSDRAYLQMGIFIEGRAPARTNPYCRVD
jgi:uncharacterized protein